MYKTRLEPKLTSKFCVLVMFVEVQHPQPRPCLHMQTELKVHTLYEGSMSQDLECHLGSGPLVERREWGLA